ncbi:MetQ/NlpA family ABC transporter substrate-binding protein [Methylobacterium sp. J-077]|uniref:MetQ/NlpA family ABC transporter substrate-binding protein n=1 Tax=Methylobacterium sp. J-077 TaxID=2836656 RepID=UPI001FBBA64D|nr:MetQ/NlpA family ABC transporter substrate-binding protein [Methylobacterium sp. J-077]MCJ2126309.1 MetQ/NlpA family ABC transporter substrate-binding protein [Methylobacterium sp. J-077]
MISTRRRTVLAGALALAVSGAGAASALRVVASSVRHAEILEFITRTLAPGFSLTVIETSGDIRPDALLHDGDADANFFQHVSFLHSQEAQLGVTFAVAAWVPIKLIEIYSWRVKTLAEVPQEASVALPNNVTNFSCGPKPPQAKSCGLSPCSHPRGSRPSSVIAIAIRRSPSGQPDRMTHSVGNLGFVPACLADRAALISPATRMMVCTDLPTSSTALIR